jgi:aminoglycoside phosphotransferase (APT) family kinase protein
MDEQRLVDWLRTQLPDAGDITIDDLDRAQLGHSAETLLFTVHRDGGEERVVLRLRPPAPGLLEPYDLQRQFDVLRVLEPTPVRAPRALWRESTGTVLGREFYVMERLDGDVYEQSLPDGVDAALVERMAGSMVDQLAAIHAADAGDVGTTHDLYHWHAEVERVKRASLPALERLHDELVRTCPTPRNPTTLVHGDAKHGNFGFVDGEVSAVYDWEMAGLGDPMTDIGWMELLWTMPGSFTTVEGAPDTDWFVARWEARTGLRAHDRPWYRAQQAYKMSAIMLVGSMHYDAGLSDDVRLAHMGYGVQLLTDRGLAELGIEERLDHGPVLPREERLNP